LSDLLFFDKRLLITSFGIFKKHNGQKKRREGQTIKWSKEKKRRTDNTMVKRKEEKDRQYNGQKKRREGQTIQWSKEKKRRTDNTMVLTIVLFVLLFFSFDHCIVCPSLLFF
jgi:preprotein translocase subunit SecE